MMLTWLPDVLRAAGLNVVEVAGWKTRGRAFPGKPKGVLAHHTGAGSKDGLIALIRDGRGGPKPLSGPLSQLFLDDDGTYYVIAAGRSNHGGPGRWQSITQGNSETIGIEARNAGDGRDLWEKAQLEAYAVGVAAILEHLGQPALMVAGHKEYALPRGRKIDPTFDMAAFRELVAEAMDDEHSPKWSASIRIAVNTVDPALSMLQRGMQGEDVVLLQTGLRELGFKVAANGVFSWETDTRVREFQRKNGLKEDGMFGSKSWSRFFELLPNLKEKA